MRPIERGWVAGFLEGEGCFSQRSVRAKQVQKEPLLRLKRLLGGNIYREKYGSGKLFRIWVWQAHGELARAISAEVLALMSPKRQREIQRLLKVAKGWNT